MDQVEPCILEYNDTPIGYMQYYSVQNRGEYVAEPVEVAFGIDLFIGEPDLWDRGIGTRAMKMLVSHLSSKLNAAKVVIDPQVTNLRAIRCYEKSGARCSSLGLGWFRRVKVQLQHELHEGELRDVWLMVTDRPD